MTILVPADRPIALTDPEKAQIKANIGVGDPADSSVVYTEGQTLSDAERWVALNNLGIEYNASLGGLTITLASGSVAFIPITTVPA